MLALPKAFFAGLFASSIVQGSSVEQNRTMYNPAIPGWHSDPSCVFVAERDNTTFCTSSTFLLTPGLPIHASKDLTNWKLISHALSRESQYPEFDQSLAQSDGIWAATIRYHLGTFYIITIYNNQILSKQTGLIFRTTDPYNDSAWADPIRYDAEFIDPDLFWDDDGTAYVATAGTNLQTIDFETGRLSKPRTIWNGTTGIFLEGPHIYRKDGYYYLLVAEGGSGLNHSVTIARSTDIWGPYEGYERNPILTNRGTAELFQNIGHADLFHDKNGQWWAAALAWRSGPEGQTYPMGRETVVTPVTWEENGWPVFAPVRGVESGWSLPASRDIPGDGKFIDEPDVVDFRPHSTIPQNFGYWRWPDRAAYTVSPLGHPNTLQLTPSFANITAGWANYSAGYQIANLTMITRLQTATLFQYSVDVSFAPTARDEEAGVTVFLNQVQNINLGIVMLPASNSTTNSTSLAPHFRFLASGLGSDEKHVPAPSVTPVPPSWLGRPIRLSIHAENATHYTFYASATGCQSGEPRALGRAPATIVSGGMGPFTGALLGVYATSNGGAGSTPAYVSRWRYQNVAQEVVRGEFITE
ncbi:xylosidase : arabinofuranosidase [Parachaetomium inaequale]|uniref:Xylosidase: arabinofuranosidase n=1 Tax=Parachaetomium inaequale TaxID=2588326 RepID=A0AAN6PQ18_9PEZI|nr:xylosidase : arabinofuranosidase [Parachaetomium inaequale]